MGWERRRDMRDMMGGGLVVVCVAVVAVVAVQFVVARWHSKLNEASATLPPPKKLLKLHRNRLHCHPSSS